MLETGFKIKKEHKIQSWKNSGAEQWNDKNTPAEGSEWHKNLLSPSLRIDELVCKILEQPNMSRYRTQSSAKKLSPEILTHRN